MLLIGGMQDLSTIDFPGELAVVVFTIGCNMNCPYCHNGWLKDGHHILIDMWEVLGKLSGLRNKVKGVVISGGEPTIQDMDDMVFFLHQVKVMGFSVKFDTNGTSCGALAFLRLKGLVDYAAIDFKTDWDHYEKLGCDDTESVQRSIIETYESGLPMEIRTTCDVRFVDKWIIRRMAMFLEGLEVPWYLQEAKPPGKPYPDMAELKRAAEERARMVFLR